MFAVTVKRTWRETPTQVCWELWEVWVVAEDADKALAKVLRRKRFVEFLSEGGSFEFTVTPEGL
jgi:hypothetical protein